MKYNDNGTAKKVPISINLEGWIWDTVDRMSDNRTRFFRNLLFEKIKAELYDARLISEGCPITENLADYYRILYREKRRKSAVRVGRAKVRRKDGGYHLGEHQRKRPISLNLEKWIWELISDLEPNRSDFFRKLFIAKMKQELTTAGLIRGDAVLSKTHGDLYCQYVDSSQSDQKQGRLG